MSTRRWEWYICVAKYVHSQVDNGGEYIAIGVPVYVHSQVEKVYLCCNICPLVCG